MSVVNQPNAGNNFVRQTRQPSMHAPREAASIYDHFRKSHDAFDPTPRQPAKTDAKPAIRVIPILKATGLLLLLAMILYGLALYFGEPISLGGHSASEEKKEIVISNTVLSVPENVIRFSAQREASAQTRLELYLHWPSLSGYADAHKDDFSNVGNQAQLLFLTLEPRVLSLDMSGRIDPIYSKFLTGPVERTNSGLMRQKLSAEGGFIDEALYFEPNSPYPFATRCIDEDSAIATPFCIRDIHIGKDLMLTYRFHIKHLNNWLAIDTSVRNYVKALIVN